MSLLSSVEPWDLVAENYAKITMQLFKGYAEHAIELADISKEYNVLDVACGPGTLALQIAPHVNSVKAIDFSETMVDTLKQNIKQTDITNIDVTCGDGQNLSYNDESFDVAFSMFGLMFFPDRDKGYAEIYRTLKPNGKILVSSWAPVSQSPAMLAVFGAIRAMNPDIPAPQIDIESLENSDFFKKELVKSGFKDVEIHLVTQNFPVQSIENFWSDMVKGHAMIVMMKKNMSANEWEEKEEKALQYLKETLVDTPASLSCDAWIGYGIK